MLESDGFWDYICHAVEVHVGGGGMRCSKNPLALGKPLDVLKGIYWSFLSTILLGYLRWLLVCGSHSDPILPECS